MSEYESLVVLQRHAYRCSESINNWETMRCNPKAKIFCFI